MEVGTSTVLTDTTHAPSTTYIFSLSSSHVDHQVQPPNYQAPTKELTPKVEEVEGEQSVVQVSPHPEFDRIYAEHFKVAWTANPWVYDPDAEPKNKKKVEFLDPNQIPLLEYKKESIEDSNDVVPNAIILKENFEKETPDHSIASDASIFKQEEQDDAVEFARFNAVLTVIDEDSEPEEMAVDTFTTLKRKEPDSFGDDANINKSFRIDEKETIVEAMEDDEDTAGAPTLDQNSFNTSEEAIVADDSDEELIPILRSTVDPNADCMEIEFDGWPTTPRDILGVFFSYLPPENWFSTKLTCKKWKEVGDIMFDPSILDNQAIKEMIEIGNVHAVRFILKDIRVDPNIDTHYPLLTASFKGCVDMVKALLAHPKIDPKPASEEIFTNAVISGKPAVLEVLLASDLFDRSVLGASPLVEALEKKDLPCLEVLLQVQEVLDACRDCGPLLSALSNTQNDTFELILASQASNLAHKNQKVFRRAVRGRHSRAVDSLLSQPTVDPTVDNNRYLKRAVKNMDTQTVELLLDRKVDPSRQDLLSIAVKNRDNAMLDLLLEYPSVNRTVGDMAPLRLAIKRRNYHAIQVLLEDQRSNPTVNNQEFLRHVVKNHDDVALELLLEDGRADPTVNDNKLLTNAVKTCSYALVERLLTRCDPSINDCEILKTAVALGSVEMVDLILADLRVDPSINDNEAIFIASSNNLIEMLKRLMEEGSVNPSDSDNRAFKVAQQNGFEIIKKILLTDPRVLNSIDDL